MRIDVVALILEENGKFLAERRDTTNKTCPGDIVFPGGKPELGETYEKALTREMREELGIEIYGLKSVYQADFDCEKQLRIHGYSCEGYNGHLTNKESQEIMWIEPERFSYDVSRDAVRAFLKDE